MLSNIIYVPFNGAACDDYSKRITSFRGKNLVELFLRRFIQSNDQTDEIVTRVEAQMKFRVLWILEL